MEAQPMSQAWVTGFDVSHYQPATTSTVRAEAGDRFVIIKATDGRNTDKVMHAHHAAAGAAGLARGAYHFYRSGQDPIEQARHFLAATADRHWELPHALDYEDQSGAALPAALLAFLDAVEQGTGRTPILYTGPAWWRNTIGSDSRFTKYPLWLARYLNKYADGQHLPTGFEVPAPSPWPAWSIWQYSDTAGRLDRDVMTEPEFHVLTDTHPTPPTEDDMTPAQEAKIDALNKKLDEALPILRKLESDYLTTGKSVRQVIVHTESLAKDLASGKRPVKP
jgi:lysozyme